MKVARPISDGGADEVRCKTIKALTATMRGMSSQTGARMVTGTLIEDALRKLAEECVGIDWELVYNELGITLDPRFDLSEIAGARKVPVMPSVTIPHIITCLKGNGCGVDSRLDPCLVVDKGRVGEQPYLVVVSEDSSGLSGRSRAQTKEKGIVEPTLREWLLFQLGYVLCTGRPWGRQVFIRCGSSEYVAKGERSSPGVNRNPLPDGCAPQLMLGLFGEQNEWQYLSTRSVIRTTNLELIKIG